MLHNADVSQLCKTIIFENTAADHNDTSDHSNSRFYCVVVQYAGNFEQILFVCVLFVAIGDNSAV